MCSAAAFALAAVTDDPCAAAGADLAVFLAASVAASSAKAAASEAAAAHYGRAVAVTAEVTSLLLLKARPDRCHSR